MWSRSQVSPQDQVFDAVLRWRGGLLEARRMKPFSRERRDALKQARSDYRQVVRLGKQYAKDAR